MPVCPRHPWGDRRESATSLHIEVCQMRCTSRRQLLPATSWIIFVIVSRIIALSVVIAVWWWHRCCCSYCCCCYFYYCHAAINRQQHVESIVCTQIAKSCSTTGAAHTNVCPYVCANPWGMMYVRGAGSRRDERWDTGCFGSLQTSTIAVAGAERFLCSCCLTRQQLRMGLAGDLRLPFVRLACRMSSYTWVSATELSDIAVSESASSSCFVEFVGLALVSSTECALT